MTENKKFIRYFIFILAVLIAGRMIFIGDVIAWLGAGATPVIIMLLTIYLMLPMVNKYQAMLEKKTGKNRRTLAVVLGFLTLFLIVAGFISIILPSLISSISAIMDQLPKSTNQITSIIMGLPFVSLFVEENELITFFKNFSNILVSFSQNILEYSTNIIISFKDAIIALGIFILSLLMAFYALRDYTQIEENVELRLRAVFGDSLISPIVRVAKMTDQSMKKFLLGKLYTCLFLGLMVGAFGLIYNLIFPKDIPYLPLIAFIIGITNIIPYVGPFIGTVPSIVFALINGFVPALALIIIVLLAQQIDNILISPKIIGDSVGLKPFWIIFSVTVGGRLFGIMGMLLTVPITSVILALLDERVKKYQLDR